MKNLRIAAILVLLISGFGIVNGQEQSLSTYSNFDFVPGERIIFYDDFTQENIGDFPALWNTNSSGEIVTLEKFPGRWFQMKGGGYYIPEAKEKFTDNFTIEFDLVPINIEDIEYLYNLTIIFVSGTLSDPNEGGAVPGKAGLKISLEYDNVNWTNYSETDGGYKSNGSSPFMFITGQKYHISFWIQKQRIRMYVNEKKILDLPRGLIDGYVHNIFRIQTTEDIKPIIANFRLAAGLPDMRNKLMTDGKIVSYGLYFDSGSDKLKPESYGTLKEIANVLKENAAVKVKIVGHTDSDGEDASNLTLSKKRAEAVKAALGKDFAIDLSRMETDGKGEGQPIVPNTNSESKAQNRRVEFIKQ
ncbi:MAG: OmpA family protein [Bacteroidota bacterium]